MDESDEAGTIVPGAKRAREHPHKRVHWTAAMRDTFLEHLAATCHVDRSAAAAGVTNAVCYNLRRRDPEFAKEWGEALEAGYQALEMRMVAHAMSGGGAAEMDGYGPDGTERLDVDLALKLLSNHRNALLGKPIAKGFAPRIATREEVRTTILKRLKLIEGRYKATGAQSAPPPAVSKGSEPSVERDA